MMAFIHFSSLLLALSLTTGALPGLYALKLSSGGLARRDLSDETQHILFSTANSSGLFIEISVAGTTTPVQIDFASADLFVSGNIPGSDEFAATSSEAVVDLEFLSPPVKGSIPIVDAPDVVIGGQTIQQPIALYSTDNPGLHAEFPQASAHGVLGFGPTSQSAIVNAEHTGHSPMDELYISNASAPFSTILFTGWDESTPPTDTPMFSGFFSVGAPIDLNAMFAGADLTDLPDLSKITSQPAIPLGSGNTFTVNRISVNGKDTTLSSIQKGASANTAIAVITTTNSFSVVPVEISQAIYASVPGVSFNDGSGVYTVPCSTLIDVGIVIGDVTVALDPASVVIPAGDGTCQGSFRAQKFAGNPGWDISFGTTFMQNVYILIGYSSVSGQTLSGPILKLLSVTDIESAHDYFSTTRTGSGSNNTNQASPGVHFTTVTYTHTPTTTVWLGSPTGGSAAKATGNEKAVGALDLLETSSTPASDSNLPSGSLANQLKHCLPAIILGAIAMGIVLIGAVIYLLVSRRRQSGTKESAYKNLHHAENADYGKALYGHDEETTTKYSDPYQDRI